MNQFSLKTIFTAILAFTIIGQSKAQTPQQPNIVLLLVDDMGWSDLGTYGNKFHETPNIDQLADSGMKFTDAYASCGVCSPSRASILTGKYPATLKITDWIPGHKGSKDFISPKMYYELQKEEVTIAEQLKTKGYDTYYVGKWHLGTGDENSPLNHGFDENIGGHTRGAPGSFYFPYAKVTPGHDWTNKNLPKDHKEGDYLTDKLTDHALEVIEKSNKRNKPFFLNMSYYTVHVPLEGRLDLVEKYKKKYEAGSYEKKYNMHYAAMVESLDQSVGRIMDKLKSLGLDKNTVVMLTSDNGGLAGGQFNGNEPLRGGKGTHYEGGIREPMIASWPGKIRSGSISKEVVSGIDILPTVMDMVGIDTKEEIDGVSMTPALFEDKKGLDREAMFWHYPHFHRGRPVSIVRAGRYKLMEFLETGKLELYDLQKDMSESTDIAAKKPSKVKELKAMLDKWKKETDAPPFRKKSEETAQFDRAADAWNGSNDIKNPPYFKAEGATVSIATFNDAEIRYTLDGSRPDKNSTVYTQAIQLPKGGRIRAKSWSPNGMESDIIQYLAFLPKGKTKLVSINGEVNVAGGDKILDEEKESYWEASNANMPYEIKIELAGELTLQGFAYQPARRLVMGTIPFNTLKNNTDGAALDYQILSSRDGINWNVVQSGTFDYRKYAFLNEQTILFKEKVKAKYINFRILTTIAPDQKPNIEDLKFIGSN